MIAAPAALLALVGLSASARAAELSVGPMFQDGYRPGARAGLHWPLLDSERAGRTGSRARHVLSGGPDLATYAVPGVHWSTLPGATLAWRRTGAEGLRLEADAGASLVVQKYLAPVYRIDDGELTQVPAAGLLTWAPTARLGVGLAPTDARGWGLVARPSVLLERHNTWLLPTFTAELAVFWEL